MSRHDKIEEGDQEDVFAHAEDTKHEIIHDNSKSDDDTVEEIVPSLSRTKGVKSIRSISNTASSTSTIGNQYIPKRNGSNANSHVATVNSNKNTRRSTQIYCNPYKCV